MRYGLADRVRPGVYVGDRPAGGVSRKRALPAPPARGWRRCRMRGL